jgi:hypothetical protein
MASKTRAELPTQRALHLKGDRYATLVKLYNAGLKPRYILTFLTREIEDKLVTARDIRNTIYKLRREGKLGRNYTEALVLELEQKG